MRESDRFFGLRTQHQRYHLLSAATLNNSRNRNFVHRKDHGRIEAGIPGSPRPHRRRRTSRSNLGQRWPARLVAAAAEAPVSDPFCPNIILITRRCYVDEWLPSCDAASARIGQVGRLGFWHYLAVGIVPAVMSLAITFGCIALTWRSTLRTEVMDGPIAAPSFDHRKL